MCSVVSISLYIAVVSFLAYLVIGIESPRSRNDVYLSQNSREKQLPRDYPIIDDPADNIYHQEPQYSDLNHRSRSPTFYENSKEVGGKSSSLPWRNIMRMDRESRNLLLYQLASKIKDRNPQLIKNVANYIHDKRSSYGFSNLPVLKSIDSLSSISNNEYSTDIYGSKRDKNLDENENFIPLDVASSRNEIMETADDDQILFPDKEILGKVQKMMKDAHILKQNEDSKRKETLPDAQRRFAYEQPYLVSEKHDSNKLNLQDIHFTTISLGTLMLFLIMVVMILALRVHCRNVEKSSQEWIRHPIVQPSTAASGAIQPNFHHLDSEPIRIKTKGLLERRGSNTSLTIDLAQGGENGDVQFSPSRECTPEDFLLTAGSRMNRRQLRHCLKDPRELHADFWQIPANHPDKCCVPGAAAKNRYRTVLPNEKTRVVLYHAPPDSPETPASQYINANYIRGYDGEEKAYIATQGPLANTIEELWLLVLQERSPALVMITRLKEKGWIKCESYVPSYAATYGSIHVTVKQIVQKNGYTIRQIYLKRGDEVHTTLHFWFMSWPDHKTPSSARHLLAMATEVEGARKECQRPVIVHCSAGIGRTGCFIAVSIGRMQLLEEDCVDVLSIVCQMRLDRGGMVQTAEQYEFIHRALTLFEATLPSTASSDY